MADRDREENDLIDRISVLVLTENITATKNDTSMLSIPQQQYSGIFNFAIVELSIELYCNEQHDGNCSLCSPLCTCNFCPCPLGYTGDGCSINIDYCEGVTCSNRGQCLDFVGSFQCRCDPGFEGDLCEIRSALRNYQLTVQVMSVNNSNNSLANTSCTLCCDRTSRLCDLSVQFCIRPIGLAFSNTSSSNINSQCSDYFTYRSHVYLDLGSVNFVTTNDPIQSSIITNLKDVSNF